MDNGISMHSEHADSTEDSRGVWIVFRRRNCVDAVSGVSSDNVFALENRGLRRALPMSFMTCCLMLLLVESLMAGASAIWLINRKLAGILLSNVE